MELKIIPLLTRKDLGFKDDYIIIEMMLVKI